MQNNRQRAQTVTSVALLLALGACSGGGGNGNNGAASTTPGGTATEPGTASLISISTSNAAEATAGPAQAGTGLQDNAGSTTTLLAASLHATAGRGKWPDLSEIARQRLNQVVHWARSGSVVPASGAKGVATETTTPVSCGEGGQDLVTWNDTDHSHDVSQGDAFTITSENCVESGETWNGTITLDILQLQGDPALDTSWSFSARLTMDGLSITDATGTVRIDGSFTITGSVQDNVFQGSVSGDNLVAMLGEAREELRDFSITVEEDQGTTAYNLGMQGTYYADDLGGSVTYKTIARFEGFGDAPPEAGKLLATGANNSKATLEALTGSMVRIQVDADGDDVFEQTLEMTWEELDQQTAF